MVGYSHSVRSQSSLMIRSHPFLSRHLKSTVSPDIVVMEDGPGRKVACRNLAEDFVIT